MRPRICTKIYKLNFTICKPKLTQLAMLKLQM